MADTAAPSATTQSSSTLRTPHSGSAQGSKNDQAKQDIRDPKTPQSAHTESDQADGDASVEGGPVAVLLAVLDWLKDRDLVPPGFATEPMPSLIEVMEHIRVTARQRSGDRHWLFGARVAWGTVCAMPATCVAYLFAWSSWFCARFVSVALVVMIVVTALSWIPLVHWAFYWLTLPYWWHRITGW